jgi:hypothetical protein
MVGKPAHQLSRARYLVVCLAGFVLMQSTEVKADEDLKLEIPAGQASVEVVVSPAPDSLSEGPETVLVSLLSDSGYQIGSSARSTLRLSDLTAPPDISGFAPPAAPVGTTVVIRGHSFVDVNVVSFNGTPATFTVDSLTQITVTVPAGASTGPIAIGTVAGAVTSLKDFTLVVPSDTWDRYWNLRDTGPNAFRLNAVTYADGLFVAVGEGGRITTSVDGIRWKDHPPVTTMQLFGITSGTIAGKNYFVAAGGGARRESGGVILKSADGLNWEVITTPLPMTAVAYGQGRFVVGGMRLIKSSTDLTSWKDVDAIREPGDCNDWSETVISMAYGGGRFVATTGLHGHDGRGHRKIISSADGTSWDRILGRSGEWWYRYGAVAYSPDFGFLITGYHSNDPEGNFGIWCRWGDPDLYTELSFWNETAFDSNSGAWAHVGSIDAKTWAEKTKPNQRGMFGASFGDGVFVTVGNQGMAQITSDGVVWQEVNTGATERLRGVTYGAGLFVAVGNKGVIVRSVDAVSWSTSQAAAAGLSGYSLPTLRGLATGGGLSIAVGDSGTVLVSSNGLAWSAVPFRKTLPDFVPGNFTWAQAKVDAVAKGGRLAQAFPLAGVSQANAGWLAGTDQGSDGTWRWDGTTNQLSNLSWATGQPDGGSAENFMMWNGKALEDRSGSQTAGYYIEYADHNLDTQTLYGVAFGAGKFVAVGEGRLYVSSTPSIWKRPADTDLPFRRVRFVNGNFIAVGVGGAILTSPDGVTWTRKTSGVTSELRDIAYGNDRYVIVGFDGTLLSSTDLATWEKFNSGNGANLHGVAFGNNMFVAIGDGIAWTSSNGQLWRLRGQTGRSFRTLEFGNNQFLASSENSPKSGLLRTLDGVTWTEVPTGYGLQFNIFAIEVGASTVRVAGEYSTLLESVPYGQLSVVSVSKVADASELGPTAGQFLFKRTGDLSKPLTIKIRVGGTAVDPDDYSLIGPVLR